MSARERLRAHLKLEFRLASPADVPQLARVLRDYMNTTDWAQFMTFDLERTVKHLNHEIASGETVYLLALQGPVIVGLASYSILHHFTTEPIALFQEIWVREDYHHSAVGRILVALATDLAKGDGAVAIHAPMASGLPAARSLKNLFFKGGYHEFGYMMRRRL
jgi:hypothetical protein